MYFILPSTLLKKKKKKSRHDVSEVSLSKWLHLQPFFFSLLFVKINLKH